ncbi:hypothetical protein HCH_02667 [Hahella chejuensis KCTC 2396]|uniref:Uncharacterized protein n=1 Tax=Hahella chejuensis (strain KCTC 2396) TaxID=349521 RepID=Q2SIR9_HAHCH|nr:hypothetical protein [Hahella chejuensis]ABC29455.1 hypothetical protein HCH_02667 [Hahella chejuensis KCTC 2396]
MNYSRILLGLAATGLVLTARAEVKSMTSGELTDTYIKDSTIIVTPTPKKPEKKRVVTYTIGPGEPVKTEAEEQSELNTALTVDQQQFEDSSEAAAQVIRELAFIPYTQPELAALSERPLPHPDLVIPDGAFTFQQILSPLNPDMAQLPYGDQLNLQSNGQQLTITIGNNLPGVDNIIIPERIQGGMIDLVPRDSGGFDLTLTMPQQ